MRLIDADRLKDSIMFTCDLGGWIGETLQQIKKVAIKYIENAPTIDAVEVVRCKNCKHWNREIHNGIEYFNFSSCDLNHYGAGHNFYCADGERREP